jgi:hypothetical protein
VARFASSSRQRVNRHSAELDFGAIMAVRSIRAAFAPEVRGRARRQGCRFG